MTPHRQLDLLIVGIPDYLRIHAGTLRGAERLGKAEDCSSPLKFVGPSVIKRRVEG
jgi:hypothetical protein